MTGILAVDVDLTVFPSDIHWWDWMFLKLGYMPEAFPTRYTDRLLSYDLSKEVRDIGYPEIERVNSLDFWRREDVYDDMQPIAGSVEVLHHLNSKGWEIVFVSAIKGNHHKSKHRALKKHFPFMSALIATKEKEYVFCDAAIDDRIEYINKYRVPTEDKFLIRTPYEQGGFVSKGHTDVEDWEDFLVKFRGGKFC